MGSGEVPPEARDDVLGLLLACPAFAGVPRASLKRLVAGAWQTDVTGVEAPETSAFVVQRGGVLVRDVDGRTVDMVTQGEFGAPEPDARIDPMQPSLVVWLPERAIDLAWTAPLDRLPAAAAEPVRSRVASQTAGVHTVMRSPVLTAEPHETCASVARRMTDERISSIVVVDGDRLGIATDRDLRTRLVADGRPAHTPIGRIATYPARTVSARTPVFEALVEMLVAGIHHLPVVEHGRLVGMVSSDDLLDLGTRSPLHLRTAVDRAEDVATVAGALGALPAAVDALLRAGTSAVDAARVIATVTDRVCERLLALASAQLGDPPSAYGWVAFGSQARREQTLRSDQDHGLVLPDGLDATAHAWWRTAARWMVDALERCGYARCPLGVMASNDVWRREVRAWRRRFSDWIQQPDGEHVAMSTLALDLRTVTGALAAHELLRPTIAHAQRTAVLGRLARDAIRHRVPLGLFGRLAVERSGPHAGSLDIKSGVMMPIVDLGRLFAMAGGSEHISTGDRLAGADDAGLSSRDLAQTLRSGYELAVLLRLKQQVEQHRTGAARHDWLDPDHLSLLARAQLRETCRAIRTVQHDVEQRYGTPG